MNEFVVLILVLAIFVAVHLLISSLEIRKRFFTKVVLAVLFLAWLFTELDSSKLPYMAIIFAAIAYSLWKEYGLLQAQKNLS